MSHERLREVLRQYLRAGAGHTGEPSRLRHDGALEAMASGRPVVVTATACMADYVLPNDSGFLVPPRQAELLGEPTLQLLEDRGLPADGRVPAR